MSDVIFHDGSVVPADGDDPLGPFGTGPAVDDPEPWIDPVSEGFGAEGAHGPIGYTDPIAEQFGDYDPFGPWASREVDYYTDPEGEG